MFQFFYRKSDNFAFLNCFQWLLVMLVIGLQQNKVERLCLTWQKKEILPDVIPNLKELIETDNLGDLLLSIDDIIFENIIYNNNEPDDEGITLQFIHKKNKKATIKLYWFRNTSFWCSRLQ